MSAQNSGLAQPGGILTVTGDAIPSYVTIPSLASTAWWGGSIIYTPTIYAPEPEKSQLVEAIAAPPARLIEVL
jgi:hypothetical protein